MEATVTVIIPTIDKKELLTECLESLNKQTLQNFQTIIIDNGSSDGTSDFIERNYPKIELIKNRKNRGFVAVNQGIRRAKTKYIVLLNNDAVASEDWLEKLVAGMEKHPEAGFGASKIMQFAKREKIDSVGDGFNLNIMAGYSIGKDEPSEKFNRERYCFSATGGASIYRKDLFEIIGLFDEKFFAYFEDIDFGFRANLLGFKCIFIPEAVVYHRGGETSIHNSRFHLKLTDRNKVITVLKNLPIKYFFKYKRASFDLFFWPFLEILKLNFSVWPFVLNRLVILFWLPDILVQRLKIARERTISDSELDKLLI